MKTELNQQYNHAWRVFTDIVKGFSVDAWLHAGRKGYSPARLSLHILQSAKFYLEDASEMILISGKPFSEKCWGVNENDLPSQDELLELISTFKTKTKDWINDHDLNAKQDSFDWTGETWFGVALFMFQHFLFHLGELSSLLNESRNGDAKDLFAGA